jgi:predicted GIY-YIG superfamily endonuclease
MDKSATHTNVYVLKCDQGKYYVGKTNYPLVRFKQHFSNRGASWTRIYKPIAVMSFVQNVSHFEEDKVVKEMMAKYGIENVRGGAYARIELASYQKKTLWREIASATDACFYCGEKGHFARHCLVTHHKRKNDNRLIIILCLSVIFIFILYYKPYVALFAS